MTVNLGVWRTPVEPAPRLAEAIGLEPGDLWLKRDDYLAAGGGGSKLRKLVHLLDVAREEDATVVVACGAAQSNFARLAAASARRLGMEAVLLLRGDGPGREIGNVSLAGLFGADVRWVGDVGLAELDELAEVVGNALRTKGERPYVLPYGGSDVLGARGYVDCAEELREQAPKLEHVVVPVGSGGTMAGLVAGLGTAKVLGIEVGAVQDAGHRIAKLAGQMGEPATPSSLRLRAEQIGQGYGAMTAAARRAMLLAAHTAGLILDPVYGAKAMAGLMAAVKDGAIQAGERTVFVCTGGLPGLLGHSAAYELSAMTRPAT
ncbi:MAG TPA: pyridoxal-phosphate dependent enzyme [Solirubrobacteraceae bacterium]|nr:pyridoxal-phosphate dependent enzyme [Solirubrobacteraceae bacterium]